MREFYMFTYFIIDAIDSLIKNKNRREQFRKTNSFGSRAVCSFKINSKCYYLKNDKA